MNKCALNIFYAQSWLTPELMTVQLASKNLHDTLCSFLITTPGSRLERDDATSSIRDRSVRLLICGVTRMVHSYLVWLFSSSISRLWEQKIECIIVH